MSAVLYTCLYVNKNVVLLILWLAVYVIRIVSQIQMMQLMLEYYPTG